MPDKASLRQHFLQIRNNIIHPQQAADGAATIFLENIPLKQDDVIAAYQPINNEISPLPLLEQLKASGHITALPVVTGPEQPLQFHSWQYGDELHNGEFFNLLEPRGNIVSPTIIIVPLLAFDKTNHRLGYGGGFYDRTLSALKQEGHKFISVGYGYACQETEQLPTDKNDCKLDYVITDSAII